MFLKKIFFASLVPVLLTGLLIVSCSGPDDIITNHPVNAKAPAITVQPQGGTWDVDEDDEFTLTVTATSPDNGELSYQWYKGTSASATNGTAIGEDDDTLTLNKEDYDAGDTLYFYVKVTNTIANNGDGGKKTATMTSSVATVTITSALVNARHPSITDQPQDGTWNVTEDDEFTLTVTATSPDNGTLSYQWYKGTNASTATGGTEIGTDDATLTLEKEHYPGDGHLYFYVVVTNTINDNGDGGTKTAAVTSAVATVTVTGNGVEMVNAETPNITGQPTGGTWNVSSANTFTLTVTATITDDGTLSYKWHKNTAHSATGGEEVGTNSATLTLEKAHYTGNGAYYFYVVVINTIDDNDDGGVKTATATSSVATVTVSGNDVTVVNAETPNISGQPTGGAWDVSSANNFTMTVTASVTDGGSLSYQWYKNTTNSTTGGEEVGTNSATLTLAKTDYTGDGAYYFYVVVTNTNNNATGTKTATATSNAATVTVSGNPLTINLDVTFSGGSGAQKTVAIRQTITGNLSKSGGGSITLIISDPDFSRYEWYVGRNKVGDNSVTLQAADADLKVGSNLITAVAYADDTPWSADITVFVTE
jgi:acid stress-induced BolA-like protein IbaG/YrbA